MYWYACTDVLVRAAVSVHVETCVEGYAGVVGFSCGVLFVSLKSKTQDCCPDGTSQFLIAEIFIIFIITS